MFTLLLTIAGAFFNAVMDSLEEGRFNQSIFKDKDPQFWYKRESWKYAPRLFGYRFDAWHYAKTLMLICLLGSPLVYRPVFGVPWDLILNYILWIISFNIFYLRVLKAKTK